MTRLAIGTTVTSLTILLGPMMPAPDSQAASKRNPAKVNRPTGKRVAALAEASNLLAKLPIRFEKNVGQTDPSVKFLVRRPGYSVFLTGKQTVFAFEGTKPAVGSRPSVADETQVVRMNLVGGRENPRTVGIDQLPGQTNYVKGKDPAAWKTNVPGYSKVKHESVYPGIDMIFRQSQGSLEYDFAVAPGADPGKIEMRFEGAKGLRLDRHGDLLISTGQGILRQRRPHLFQPAGDGRRVVEGSFAVKGKRVGFKIGDYDRRFPLVIDPRLTYSSYFGGLGDGSATGISTDASGYIYLVGSDTGPVFPTQRAFQPAHRGGLGELETWVAKLSPNASSLEYSTYLGGSRQEYGNGVASGPSGQAYVVGSTLSPDFPITPHNAFQASTDAATSGAADAFVTELDAGGLPVYSTFLGGAGNEVAYGVAQDPRSRKIFVVGETGSSVDDPLTPANEGFPTTGSAVQPHLGGFIDAFLTVIDTSRSRQGSLAYSTYLGASGEETAFGIDADSGIAHFTGYAGATSDPNEVVMRFSKDAYRSQYSGGSTDAFLASINTNPGSESMTYATLFGGGEDDSGVDVALDRASGRVAVVGSTRSSADGANTFPTKDPFQPDPGGKGSSGLSSHDRLDGFVAAFDPRTSGESSLLYSSYLGGSRHDRLNGVAVDPSANHLILVGTTASQNFPTRNPVTSPEKNFGTYGGGNFDAVVARLDANRKESDSLLFSSFLGGLGADQGFALALEQEGHIWIAGDNDGGNYPVAGSAIQPQRGGSGDAFFSRLEAILPVIDRIDPPKGPISGGTRVTLEGKNFQGAYRVKFGEAEAASFTPDPASPDTKLVAESPPHAAGPVHVRVTTHEGISKETPADVFTYEASQLPIPGEDPFIAALTPPRGPTSGGTPVLITGTRFSGATEVRFGDVIIPASAFSSASDSDIRLVSPPHPREETVQVRVVTPGGVSNPAGFTYFADPIPLAPEPPPKAAEAGTLPSGGVNNVQRPLLPVPPGGTGLVPGPSSVPITVPVSAPGGTPATVVVTQPGAAPGPTSVSVPVPTMSNVVVANVGAVLREEEQAQAAPKYNMVARDSDGPMLAALLLTASALLTGCSIQAVRRRISPDLSEDPLPVPAPATGCVTGGSSRLH